jgi:hypothetical protein
VSAHDVIKEELSTAAGFDTTTTWAQRVLDALDRHGFAVVQKPHPPSGFEACSGHVWGGEQ